MARQKFRKLGRGARCDAPEWRDTKRGERCVQVCTNENGREQWKFVSGSVCEGKTRPEDVEQFSGKDEVGEFNGTLTPMPLMSLDELNAPPPRRRRRR